MSKMNTLGNKNMQGKTPAFLKDNGSKKQGRGVFGLVFLAIFGVFFDGTAWGQAGYWNIANDGGYNSTSPSTNYYLVPAANPQQPDNIDAYYSSDYSQTNGDPAKPFLTTFKTIKDDNSIWQVIEAAGGSNYFYIKHVLSGKYVIYEPPHSDKPNRKSMHLLATDTPGDNAKFEITTSGTGYKIRPISLSSGNRFFNPAGSNTDTYYGQTGNDYYSKGLVGVYSNEGGNSIWHFEVIGSLEAPSIIPDATNQQVTIVCTDSNATIYYTLDGSIPDNNSTQYDNQPINIGPNRKTVKAIAYKTINGLPLSSSVTSLVVDFRPVIQISSLTEITNVDGRYQLTSDITATNGLNITFTGEFDANLHTISGLTTPLFTTITDAVIKNVKLKEVNIVNHSGNTGAICGTANGDSRIYNCGILPTDPNFTTTSSVGSSDAYCGGLVGLLDGSSRVINCYSFADITGGTTVAGIVGYNGYSSTSADLRTMVMNCMFYGNIAGATQISPIYGGQKISNVGATGLNNYNYFRYESAYSRNGNITEYNCALGAEERYLVRFEFHRTLLNSNRALAAFYATGSADESEMLKWVLDKTVAPYPILKVQGTYPTVVNYDAVNVVDIDANNVHRNEGRRLTDLGNNGVLTVNIQAGNGAVFNAPNGASLGTTSLSINIIDKDYDDFNFNYGKIQLPYYNEVGSGNYTGNRVVTGWKIVGVTGGEKGTYVEADEFGGYNYADREHWAKDYYNTADGGSGRIFNQGAYWEVPYGVTAITIEPYWAQCVYLSDPYYDVTYTPAAQATNFTAHDLTVAGVRYNNDTEYSINGSNQKVYTTVANARTALASNKDHTPFDYAIVLVGNYHFCQGNSTNSITGHNYNNSGDVAKQPYTFMSADLDFDNEPDNVMLYQHGHLRTGISPVRFDFFPVVGIGMAHKEDGIQFMPEAGTFWNSGWFEITNTSLIKLSQIEYATNKQMNAPIILQGGIYDYFYSYQGAEGAGDTPRTTFIHVGGNAYFDDFSNGSHLNNTDFTPHVPISVTGGDFNMFYLSGYTLPKNGTPASGTDDAECYIDGGRFEEMAGAGMWAIDGDVTWSINNADITSFFGGGINGARPITGSISTTIANSHVSLFCGGPKFGDMTENKTVVTTATDCVFGKYFGAGYGGTAFNRITATENNNVNNTQFTGWDGWLDTYYSRQYSASNGISTNYELLFFQYSGGGSFKNVAQIYVNYASLSLSTTRGVTSTLNNCTVNFDFYGGGNLGNVQGNVVSTLTDCVVHGSVFGGGFSATAPTVEVYPLRTDAPPTPPYLNGDAGVFVPAEYPSGVTYTWKHANSIGTGFDDTDGHFILTTENLDNLGKVVGNTEVRVLGRTKVFGNIYGGGNEGEVSGNTKVIVNGQSN